MIRLGLRLSVRGGREAAARLAITAAAVAVGVAVLLTVLASYHAFQAANKTPNWQDTLPAQASAATADTAGLELWNYSQDTYKNATIHRLDVAPLGANAPVPPGISRLPGPGEYYASPALAALLRQAPSDEFGDRFPGRMIGEIGDQALTGPTELVVYVGHRPDQLASAASTIKVDHINTGPQSTVWTSYFRTAFAVGALALLFPILILIGTATRLSAARREERFAALRLLGATARQINVIASIDAMASALLGTLLGIGLFLAVRPAVAGSGVTGARHFGFQVTPTIWGYLGVLGCVPVASALAALVSLRRVRISPLGVSRRATPPAPRVLRVIPLLVGVALFVVGLAMTDKQSIGTPTYPGLIVILMGLVVGGPWLTARAAVLLERLRGSASSLLAARRLADNPKAAFRSVNGLVLAVFLGTMLAGLLPAITSMTDTPSVSALSNVLVANVTGNCGGSCSRGNLTPEEMAQAATQQGLEPSDSAPLLAGLRAMRGTSVVPIYTNPRPPSSAGWTSGPTSAYTGSQGPPGPQTASLDPTSEHGHGGDSIIVCADLRLIPALGACRAGLSEVEVQPTVDSDNPRDSARPIVTAADIGATDKASTLRLQTMLVKVSDSSMLERVRTYVASHTALGTLALAPKTIGEEVQARRAVAETVQRLFDVAVIVTLLTAGCSLAVSVGGGLVERKRPFSLLRLSGTPARVLYRVVLLESVLPLVAATVLAAGLAYGMAVLTVHRMAPVGTPLPMLGGGYYLTIGAGLAASLAVIALVLPMLRRLTSPETARFE